MKIYQFSKIAREIGKGAQANIAIFNQLLSSKSRLKSIRKAEIKTDGLKALLGSLARINPGKLWLTVVVFMVQLGITICSPFLTNYLIGDYLEDEAGLLVSLLAIFLGYKVVKSAVGIVCDFCYQSLGYEYFARLYWHVLANHHCITGKMLNLIEYDCNMISNLPYASLTAFFNLLEMLAILALFTYYLSSTSSFSVFAAVIVLYICSQTLVSFFTFQFTKKYLLEKDKRLSYNISNDMGEEMRSQRDQELDYNRKFLLSKILSKFITIIYPMLINLYVFVFTDASAIKDTEYILLILISLIRNPINELLFTLNLMVEISNSCQRIINFQPAQEAHLHEGTINDLAQEDEPLPTKMATGGSLNQERGVIKLRNILSYCFKNNYISAAYWVLLLALVVLMLAGKFYNYSITKHIVSHTYTTSDFVGLAYQLIIPLLFYYFLIIATQKISRGLFIGLRKCNLSCEFLNRISGDITAIDRSITINLNETLSSLTFIISSYLYSIYSLNNTVIQVGLVLFLLLCLAASFKLNRFIMLSRREVARKECLLKSHIIKRLITGHTIQSSKVMKKSWRNIFECKEMGLFIENYFMIILNVVLLVFSMVLVAMSKQLDISSIDKSILLIACLNVDFDLVNMFLSAVRLEICLVSFQRVINVIAQ